MGPKIRLLGPEVPDEELIWQDPIPAVDYPLIAQEDIAALKAQILESGLSVPQLVRTAWASASTFRASDMRGGANGARIALEPQKDWPVNNPDELAEILGKLKAIQADYDKKVSLADLIVLGGAAAIEKAAMDAGHPVTVPFVPGRADTTQEKTDVQSFALLEPAADAFRNYFNADKSYKSPAESMVDKADQLNLTVPEMTVLVGGMRALDANAGGSKHGVLTSRPGTLSNDFFVNLLDMSTRWQKADEAGIYEGLDRTTGEAKYTATTVDLIFGSNAELRATAEVYAMDDSKEKFIEDFVKAWTKVMTLDRFDL